MCGRLDAIESKIMCIENIHEKLILRMAMSYGYDF